MKATTVALSVYALDKTERVFNDISRRAHEAAGPRAWGAVSGAIRDVAGAISVAFAGVQSWVNEMSRLSDMAAIASMSTEQITKLDTAFKVLGVDVGGVNGIVRMMGHMARTTGRQGYEGFRQTVGEIANITDATERASVAQQVLGRNAFMLGPIFDEVARQGVDALDRMTAAMPGVSQAAADAGDNLADAFTIAWQGVKSAFVGLVEEMIATWNGAGIELDIRKSAMSAAAYMEYGLKVGWRHVLAATQIAVNAVGTIIMRPLDAIKRFLELLAAIITGIAKGLFEILKQSWNFITGKGFDGRAVAQAFIQDYKEAWDDAKKSLFGTGENQVDLSYKIDTADLDEKLKKSLAAAEKAITQTGPRKFDFDETAAADSTRSNRRNDWLGAGSYRAATYAMRPEYGDVKSEVKGIRRLLEKVNDSIKKAADEKPVQLEVV